MREFVHTRVSHGIELWQRYEHRLGVGALLLGFTFDIFLAKSPDNVTDNILLLSYLFIAAAIIVILNLRSRRFIDEQNPAQPLVLLLILQFCFGGLASNLLVLYGKSGTLSGSAIFIGMLVALVFGNEYLRSRYAQLRFNILVYYFLLLTYCVISAPTFLFHSLGTLVFVASGFISLAVIGVVISILYVTALRKKSGKASGVREIMVLVGVIFVIFNGLYFLDVIPPVPLSLKTIGIYHSVLHYSGGGYAVIYEEPPWYMFWSDTSSTYHYTPGESAYCFSAVYAPADLTTPIVHHWEHYNSATGSWDTAFNLSFPITGGRAGGYKGWSATAALSPGAWRCNVENATGAIIGRVTFTAVPVPKAATLTSAVI